jgi:hypothetical protein
MTFTDYSARAELYLGSDHTTAMAQGARSFATAAQALIFAFEHAAPVSLRGASLAVDALAFSGDELAALYHSAEFPLPRKGDITRSRQRRARGRRIAAFRSATRAESPARTATA